MTTFTTSLSKKRVLLPSSLVLTILDVLGFEVLIITLMPFPPTPKYLNDPTRDSPYIYDICKRKCSKYTIGKFLHRMMLKFKLLLLYYSNFAVSSWSDVAPNRTPFGNAYKCWEYIDRIKVKPPGTRRSPNQERLSRIFWDKISNCPKKDQTALWHNF